MKKHSILFPKKKSPSYHIDEMFFKEVILHIVKNKISTIKSPLILSIQGKRGEGKTSHILEICNNIDIVVILVHGSIINGDHEGEPVNIITDAYFEASEITNQGQQCVILFDDIDTSVASVSEDREYTVNSQLVNGIFMSLANDPYHIGERETNRIPIFFTGNNLTNLYSPLRRTGRMRIFSWTPDKLVKIKIINNIFQDLISDEEQQCFIKIIERYIEQPISFFVDLKNNLYDNLILDIISQQNNIINFKSIEKELINRYKERNYLNEIKNSIKMLELKKLHDFNK